MATDRLEPVNPKSLPEELAVRGLLLHYMSARSGPFPELFHYTSPDGLKGIIDDKSIWLTNAAYVNDEHELTYPVQITRAVISAFIEREPEARHRQFLTEIASAVDSHAIYKSWFISSFTTIGNSLSQWRGYCPTGGYSIGFNSQLLINFLPESARYLFGPIIYDQADQRRRVEAVIRNYLAVWSELRDKYRAISDGEYDRHVATNLSFWLSRELIFFKLSDFAVELEWRIAKSPFENERILFRNRNGVLTPYLSASLVTGQVQLPLSSLYVSPLGDIELATYAARSLLQNRGYTNVKLFTPEIHLRF